MKRRSVLLGSGLALSAPLLSAAPAEARPARLTNLAHLDFLRDTVTAPALDGHTTYRLDRASEVGVLWTYAEPNADGTYRRIGGGAYDPSTGTYGQGAFNSDDIARAAVVYLRHWRQTGAAASRAASYALLRGLTYFQTATGPDAGNVILWMQSDGTLNPSADPPDSPDPSDSGPSYWLARTVWALGEGYAAWRSADGDFAQFLRQRLDLAVSALNRQVLRRYGTWQTVDGKRTPAWLIVDGADATAEAVLGLAAYVEAGGGEPARRALRQFAEGIAALADGDARTWPFGAVRPWALSLSDWHAWASQMPAALARAARVLGDARLAGPAVTDAAVFTPWLLTSGGPDNGRLPARIDRSQIAYGVDSRLQSLLAVAATTGRDGLRRLAGILAAWYFGANAAGTAAYDPATGRTVDGIAADGTVNRNAGAESTIHGLLSMLALDADPQVAALARQGHIAERVGAATVEAEQATLSGGATVVTPPSAWTGESQYSNGAYVRLPAGSSVRFRLSAADQPRLVLPIVDLQPGSAAVTRWSSADRPLGTVQHGRIGPQGTSPAPGALLPVTLGTELPAGPTDLVATASGGDAVLDAVMLEPLVSRYVITGGGHTTVLLHSAARTAQPATIAVPGAGAAVVETYDDTGALRGRSTAPGSTVRAVVLPGGFTVIQR
ncbi:hypothetical protein [Dactylosporangium matsuzakiense]|uniref:Uncharacterized protein n=1 Tax=Dactylosporangium matsuzakiense TaxID=53360 RepID=A0A9W6KPE5_9ACTN|nr:hypothetical protein [Dactylosporangium matsuzakiense]UWZ40959.1 hypothetical protein Dmats_24845 [Dactylosporangium matsuzakiense]GLL04837.1 hypothetical protein GCM10017581_065840 [Dactylosporangium matsuzakiense]